VSELISTYSPTVCLFLLGTGVLIGLLGGLLGVGGGVIAVPVLIEILPLAGVAEPLVLPVALGTAQANILLASLISAHAHWRGGTIDRTLVRLWLPALGVGTCFGIVLGPLAPARLLTALFAGVAATLAVKMMLGPRYVLSHRQPTGFAAYLAPGLVGTLSAAVAVGGGTLSTPVLSLFSFPIHRAIGAGALFNIVVALPATASFLVSGTTLPGRPIDAVGEVALFCVATLSLPALFVAPIAARWSARAPLPLLRRLFALCLGAIALRLMLRL
jgi:uncharacterized membrane protein YfcA